MSADGEAEGAGPDVYQMAQAYSIEAAKERVERLLNVRVGQIEREALAGSHAVFFLRLENGTACVARVATHPEHDLAMELWATEQARSLGLPVPETLAADLTPYAIAPPLMIARRMPGRSAYEAPLSPAQRANLFERLGRYAARLHQRELSGFGTLVPNGAGYAGRYASLSDYLNADLAAKLDALPDATLPPGRKRSLQQRVVQHRAALERPTGRLLHGDFRFKNLLIEGDQITSILDFEMALSGDPVMDIAWALYSDGRGAEDLQAMRRGYEAEAELDADGSFETRFRFYQIRYALETLWWAAEFQDADGVRDALKSVDENECALDRL